MYPCENGAMVQFENAFPAKGYVLHEALFVQLCELCGKPARYFAMDDTGRTKKLKTKN